MKRQPLKKFESLGSTASVATIQAHALITKRGSLKYSQGHWFHDTGATDHMCHEHNACSFLKKLSPMSRTVLGNDTVVYPYGINSIYLSSQILQNHVLHVPDLGIKLLSVSTVT